MELKRRLILVILSVLFLLSAALTASFGLKYVGDTIRPLNEMTQQANSVATFMTNYYRTATAQPSLTPSPVPTNSSSLAAPKLLPPTATIIPTPTVNLHAEELLQALSLVEIDFPAWQSLNSDVQAWIHNESIRVDYPILKSPDNEYYLTRDLDLSYKAMGSIFFDFRNKTDFSDPNTIIYGHNFDNGLMFSNLVWYKSQQFYEQNPVYYLYTPEQVYRVDIAAGIVVSETDTTYLVVDFNSDAEFHSLIQKIEENSVIETEIELTPSDRLVTLYTCTNDWQGQRFVVIGKITPLGSFAGL
jgi:SrtB family sortase